MSSADGKILFFQKAQEIKPFGGKVLSWGALAGGAPDRENVE